MSSKYDEFWEKKIDDLKSLISGFNRRYKLNVAGITRIGSRKSWYGKVEVGKYVEPKSGEAHMTSLGNVMRRKGLFDAYPEDVFLFSMSSDGKFLRCEKGGLGKDSIRINTKKKRDKKLMATIDPRAIAAIEFLDKLRWENDFNYLYAWPDTVRFYKQMDVSKRVLVHFLAYLANAMIPADTVWKYFVPKDSELIDEYYNFSRPEEITNLVNRYEDNITAGLGKQEALKAIETSLIKLKVGYNGSLLSFVDYSLSARSKGNPVFEVLEGKFFDLIGANFTKRVRCIIRDYKKWSVFDDLCNNLSENGRKIWEEEFKTDQLELPVDANVKKTLENLSGETIGNASALMLPEPLDVLWQVGKDRCPNKKKPGECNTCFFGGAEVFKYVKCPTPGRSCEAVKALFKWRGICPGSCPIGAAKSSCHFYNNAN